MKKLVLMLAVLLLLTGTASAELNQSPILNTAMSMLEKGNLFLERYNEITGAGIEAQFEEGMPYFFGGKFPEKIFSRYPDYYTMAAWQNTKYYKNGTRYLMGFDCAGYTDWIREENGLGSHGTTDEILYQYGRYKKYYLYTNNSHVKRPMPDYSELAATLQVGDLLCLHTRSNHIMMFIGTLRDYGFTAEELPILADYLDYPLMIHCGPSPIAGEKFQQFLDAHSDQYKGIVTTDGCVQVSIFGVPRTLAEVHETVQVHDFDYIYLPDGTPMTFYDVDNAAIWCWLRMDE